MSDPSTCTPSCDQVQVASSCPLCSFEGPSVSVILSHLRVVHSSDPNFVVRCGISGCATTSRSFSSFYSHIYRRHPGLINKRKDSMSSQSLFSTSVPGEVARPSQIDGRSRDFEITQEGLSSFDLNQADIRYLTGVDQEEIQHSSALFLLKLKEHRRTTQTVINDVVEGCKDLFSQTIQRLEAGVKATLAESGFGPESISGLDDVFKDVADPFKGIDTCHLQEKYYKEVLGLIEPKEIRIGDPEYVPQFSGAKRRLSQKWDTYQYVPLLSSLKALLQDSTIMEQIEQCPHRIRKDGLIEDICDGERFQQHPIFSQDPFALQLIAYYDELEICNPLGAHVKTNKLGIFFYSLGNIAPKYRSQLKTVNLAIVATVPVIEKYGLDKVLQPFLTDVNTLSTAGISVTIKGLERVFKGALLTFLADNLASNDLGGFKKSFSFAFRSCRTCLVTRDSLSSSFTSEGFESRNDAKHEEHIQKLVGPTENHFSMTYGVNRRSSLQDFKFFSMFGGGLPHDAMHDIFEGIAPLEIKLMLSYYVSQGLFTLDDFNTRLINFSFGYSENDKPVPILSQALNPDKSIRSSASQMLLLVKILPFLVGDKIPEEEEHWACFILLRKIIDIVLCPVASTSLCSSLKILIKEHHSKFVYLYDKCIPKMHFLLHYPEQIQAVGPMVRTWTIRHEAKLSFFKKASHLANFKNIAFSLANRHQRWLCYELASNKLLHNSVECGPAREGDGLSVFKDEPQDIKEGLIAIIPELNSESVLFRPVWVKKDGVVFRSNNAYIIIGSDGLDPVFGLIQDVLVVGGDMVIFVISKCSILYFDSHYHAYTIAVTSHKLLVSVLLDYNVYHGHKLADGLTYIPLKYHFHS